MKDSLYSNERIDTRLNFPKLSENAQSEESNAALGGGGRLH